jgi:hypothetical protein
METLSVCLLCGGKWKPTTAPPVAIGHQFFPEPYGLAKCQACSVWFVNPRPTEQRLNALYDSDIYDCHNAAFSSDPDIRLNIIERFTSPTTLCDYGAGSGEMLRRAAERGWNVQGVEPGRTRTSLQEMGYQVSKDIAGINPVSILTMVHVLEHCQSPRDTLIALRRKLLPDNLIYIEVPNANSLRARLANSPLQPIWTYAPERFLAFPIHLFYFTPRSLRLLLRQCQFQVLTLGTMGMGVEELFHSSNSGQTDSPQAVTIERRPRFRFARQMVKNSMSRLRLGENLYVVATAHPHSNHHTDPD